MRQQFLNGRVRSKQRNPIRKNLNPHRRTTSLLQSFYGPREKRPFYLSTRERVSRVAYTNPAQVNLKNYNCITEIVGAVEDAAVGGKAAGT